LVTNDRGVAADDEKHGANREFAVLHGCLVEGDAEQKRRERQIRRRALVISTLLQAAVLAAIVAIPFFGKSERIALANVTPVPPYYQRGGEMHEHVVAQPPPAGSRHTFCFLCPQLHPATPAAFGRNGATTTTEDSGVAPTGPGIDCSGCVPIGDAPPPERPHIDPQPVKLLRVTHLDPAMITTRVEPVYPALPKQMRREGRVELRAIISTEGRIESLEAVGGDALFYQSAMDAVRQWRYKPTILNGSAVEVETYITIIYTLDK
jgi:TonB family protein